MSGYLVPTVRIEKSARKSKQARRARQQRNQAAAGPSVPPELAGQAQRDLRVLEAAEAGHSHPAFQREPIEATPPPAAVNHATTPASAARSLTSRRLKVGGGIAAGVGAAGAGGYLVHRKVKQRKELLGVGKSLPRYLKDIAPGIGASGTRTFRGGEPLKRGDYAYLRVRAHQNGKHAGRLHATWQKAADKVAQEGPLRNGNLGRAEDLRQPVRDVANRGRVAREAARKTVADNTPIVRPKRRKR